MPTSNDVTIENVREPHVGSRASPYTASNAHAVRVGGVPTDSNGTNNDSDYSRARIIAVVVCAVGIRRNAADAHGVRVRRRVRRRATAHVRFSHVLDRHVVRGRHDDGHGDE